jgi:hypothetical protein
VWRRGAEDDSPAGGAGRHNCRGHALWLKVFQRAPTMTTEHDKKVDQLVEMGFDRKKADLALSRSHDDLEVAMNFLVGPDDNDEIFSLREEGNLIRATEAPLAAETVGIPIIPSNYASNTYANPSGILCQTCLPLMQVCGDIDRELAALHLTSPRPCA